MAVGRESKRNSTILIFLLADEEEQHGPKGKSPSGKAEEKGKNSVKNTKVKKAEAKDSDKNGVNEENEEDEDEGKVKTAGTANQIEEPKVSLCPN